MEIGGRGLSGGDREQHHDERYDGDDAGDSRYRDEQEDEARSERSRHETQEFGDYDEAEERWHLHRHHVSEPEDEERPERSRDETQELGDYDEAEERWNL